MRKYSDPTNDERCVADRSPLKDGSLAHCMRRATIGDLWRRATLFGDVDIRWPARIADDLY